jgi:hypothetical protein
MSRTISMSDMQKMAQSAYSGQTHRQIGSYRLLAATPTLKFYIHDRVIVVSVRGTEDARDVAAWDNVALSTLDNTDRFREDLQKLTELQRLYPPSQYHYIGVGHSLGAAILDRFLRMGLIKNALSYNGAVEPRELGGNPRHRRIYSRGDPLYQIAGHLIPGVEVRQFTMAHLVRSIFSPLYASYQSHMLGNFIGGGTHRENVLERLGLEQASLDELSEATGIARRTLQEVYNRGIGAYKTNPTSVRMKGSFKKGVNAPMSKKLSKEQWAMARVYSFLDGNPKHDQDLRRPSGRNDS